MAQDLHLDTQVYENYYTPDDPYWKPKGGQTYVVRNVTLDVDGLREIVRRVSAHIEASNSPGYSEENVIDWRVVPAGTLTSDEENLLRWEGHVEWPSPVIDVVTGQRLNPYHVPRPAASLAQEVR